jgi:hypothetical protein
MCCARFASARDPLMMMTGQRQGVTSAIWTGTSPCKSRAFLAGPSSGACGRTEERYPAMKRATSSGRIAAGYPSGITATHVEA